MEKKAKILLVDDDIDFVESTKIILESKPYEVIVAYEGDEGLQKAREENPDLILLDIIMPIKDGFTAAEQLKKDPQLPFKLLPRDWWGNTAFSCAKKELKNLKRVVKRNKELGKK